MILPENDNKSGLMMNASRKSWGGGALECDMT